MPDIFPAQLKIDLPFYILLLLTAVAAVSAWFVYRKTAPPVSLTLRYILGFLRGTGIFLLLSLFFAPNLTMLWKTKKHPRVDILIDRSASMGIKESNRRRIDRANAIAEILVQQLRNKAGVRLLGFDVGLDSIAALPADTGSFATDFYKPLKAIHEKEKDNRVIVLITDGNQTSGSSPLFDKQLADIPVFTVGVGDTVEAADIYIQDVRHNNIVYRNRKTTIEVVIGARGVAGGETVLSIARNGKRIEARKITVPKAGLTRAEVFEIQPRETGLQVYTISIEELPSESVRENNVREISLNVLKDKLKTALVASAPGYEFKFMRHVLASMEDIELRVSVSARGKNYYQMPVSAATEDIDLLILINYPGPNTSAADLAKVSQVLNSNVPAIFIETGRNLNRSINLLQTHFGVTRIIKSGVSPDVQPVPTVQGRLSRMFDIYDEQNKNAELWTELPPLNYNFREVSAGTGWEPLLEASANRFGRESKLPLILAKLKGRQRRMLLIGRGFWRWQFQMAEDRQYSDAWKKILNNFVNRLCRTGSNGNVIISTDRTSYEIGESVGVNIQVYDASFRPVDDAAVQIAVTGGNSDFELESSALGKGLYRSEFIPGQRGRLNIIATANRNDVQLGQAKKDIVITALNTEFRSISQNAVFLRRLALQTGGKYFIESRADSLINYLKLTPTVENRKQTIELWNKLSVLILIIALFSIEWFLRKKLGLA